MSGSVTMGVTDPELGEKAGQGAVNFAFTLELRIPSLLDFLNTATHQAEVHSGGVRWDGIAKNGTPIATGGSLVMYRNVTPDGRKKQFDFTFSFQADNGDWYTVNGQKHLSDDAGFDPASDLSTLFVRITKAGPPVAAGITRVHVSELLDQVASLETTGAGSTAESLSARAAFLTFMNDQIHQVYPSVPFLFQVDPERYFSPLEWRALSLCVAVMLPAALPAAGPTIQDTVLNLQNFVRNADMEGLSQIRTWLGVFGLVAPIVEGHLPTLRDCVQKLLASDEASPGRTAAELLYRMAVLPYFSHPKADALVGYRRQSFTPKFNTKLGVSAVPAPRLYDVAIVGAGVAGSLLAQRLTQAGKSVLLLEAGPYVAERDMTSDDLVLTARLYKGSGLRTVNDEPDAAKSDGTFPVMQGGCVGGGGTINNAICFQLPDARVASWQALGFPIATDTLRAAYLAVGKELRIKPVSDATRFRNPAGLLLKGLGPIKIPKLEEPPGPGLAECLVNVEDCEGLGYCNSGCGSERKRNALQVYLPQALATGACDLVANAKVVEIKASGGAVTGLGIQVGSQRFDVRANEYVLSAGPIASSELLLASPNTRAALDALHVPVGQRFCANVGSPLFARFKRVIHERPSFQISHSFMPPWGFGFIVETWFLPPGTLTASVPGFLQAHFDRMLDYSKLIIAAPLVGTQARGSIRVDQSGTHVRLPVRPEDDLMHLKQGVATVARAILAGNDPDFVEVIAGTRTGFSIKSEGDIDAFLGAVKVPTDLRLGTGHPQGGNAMSNDPAIGVIDGEFRVRGFSNLRICDSSVYPEVAGVNPQWTAMALAHHCAEVMVA
jgi:choline dehydrogenase-like flavoprotein